MRKKRLTDGLLQIALLLSLWRRNTDEYLHILTGYNNIEYELNTLFEGPTTAISQTSHFHSNNWDSEVGTYIHPKNIDNSIPRSVFRNLYNVGYDIETPTIATYLLPVLESRLQLGSESTNANANEQGSDSNNNDNRGTNSNSESVFDLALPGRVGDDLTLEDMELIDILWRQDIDLGVGKECFDVNLRRELEKKQELEDEKEKEKAKQEEQIKNETEALHELEELSRMTELVVDGETGELVPVPIGSRTSESQTNLTSEQGLSIEEAIEILQDQATSSSESRSNSVSSDVSELPLTTSLSGLLQNIAEPSPLVRQESIEGRWSDVQDLLGVTLDDNAIIAVPQQQQPNALLSNATEIVAPSVTPFETVSSLQLVDVLGGNPQQPLIQNATLGAPALNTTELLAAALETGALAGIDNETGAAASSSMFQLNNTDTALFPNASISNSTNFLLDLLDENNMDTDDAYASELHFPGNQDTIFTPVKNEDPLSDSAMGSSTGSASPYNSDIRSNMSSPFNVTSALDELEGATGGFTLTSLPKDSKVTERYEFYGGADAHPTHTDFQYPDQTNSSDSNSSESFLTPALPRHVQHNHTYPALPGQEPKERKCDINARMMKNRNTTFSRDEKKAKQLQLPFTVEEIIHSPVEKFSDMLTKYKLTEPQLQMMKDIRRRGKNKVAAQNCRKRKMEVIETLEEEVERMRRERDTMTKTRTLIDKERNKLRDKYNALYREVFTSLRDEHGQPYDPSEYTLQHTSDGNVFLVPKSPGADLDVDQNKNKKKRQHKK